MAGLSRVRAPSRERRAAGRAPRLARGCCRRALAALAVVGSLFAAGCATGPADRGRTTVTLLPDQDGHLGGVSVTTAAGTRQLDEAWDGVTVAGQRQPRIDARPVGREAASAEHRELLAAQPTRPRSLVLYFVLDTTALTERSKALLPEVQQAARDRRPTEITVYGHTDTLGNSRRNLALSEQRARAVADLLRKGDPTLGPIAVRYFGDRLPLVPTGPNAAEPRNRRVEIEIL